MKEKEIPALYQEKIQGYDPFDCSKRYALDIDRGLAYVDFIEKNLKHSKGEFAGKAFILEDWQKKIIVHLFGWIDKKTGLRRFRKNLIYIPRKNGKTFIAAGLGIILFVSDDEPGAEVYCAAAESQQAALVFSEASSMILQNKELSEEIQIFIGYKSMKFDLTNSFWRVLSSDASTKHGLNPHAYIVDEVHAQKNSELMEILETGTGARRQPLGIYLTTADYARDSACNRLYSYAKKVRDGELKDDTFFPVIYEAVRDLDDWEDEKTWYKANPNLGISLKLEYLQQQYKRAKSEPEFENTFKRLHLNMQTEQEMRWMQMHEWDACGQKIEKEDLLGKRCFAGLDLSSTNDITAIILYFPEYSACLSFFFVPKETAEKRIEYEMWERQGYIEITEQRVVDYERIRDVINELSKKYKIEAIGYDPWNSSQIALKLGDDDGFQMIEFRQGYKSMNEPTKELYKKVLEHSLIHFNNPVLRWMVSNAQVKEDPAGNIKLIKPAGNSPLKIDGIIALVIAFGLTISEIKEADSVFDTASEDSFGSLLDEIYN